MKPFKRNRLFPIEDSEPFYKKIFAWLLVLWPILNIYGLFTVYFGIGDLIIIPVSLYLFVVKKIYRNKGNFFSYFTFFIISIFLSLFSTTITDYLGYINFASIFRKLLYVFVFSYIAPRVIDIDYFIASFKKVSLFLAAIIVVQLILYYSIGFAKPFIIKSDTILVRDVDGYETFIERWNNSLINEGFEPTSIFSEASKYAQYVTPCLILSLFSNKKKHYFIFELFVSITLVLTKSANAVVFLLIAWLMWLVLSKKIKPFVKLPLLLVGAVFAIHLFFGNTWVSSRISEIGQTTINSGNMRILRGWLVFGQLPVKNAIFGVGVSNIANYILLSGISTPYDGGYVGYMSGLSEIACTTGIIGLSIFLILCLIYFLDKNPCSKALVILLLVTISSSAILDTPTFGLSICLLDYFALRHSSANCKERTKTYENRHNYFALYR